jgi:signal transduction histidine kinase
MILSEKTLFMLFEIMVVFFEMFIVHQYLKGYLLYRNYRNRICYLLSYLLFGFVLSVLSLYCRNIPMILLTSTFLGVLLISVLFFEGKITQKLCAAIIFIILAGMSEIACAAIVMGLSGNKIFRLGEYGSNRIVFVLVSKLIQILLVYLMSIYNRRRKEGITFGKIVPLLLCQIFSVYLINGIFVYNLSTPMNLELFFSVLAVLYVNLIIFWHVETIKDSYEIQWNREMAENQLNAQIRYYKELESQHNFVKGLWHDMDKHIRAIENLVAADHRELAAKYIEEIKRTIDQISVVIDTANPILNAVLHEYMKQAELLNIQMDMDLSIPNELAVQPMDLAVIIGNTVENAIAACSDMSSSESGERRISIRLFKQGSLLFYEIINPLGRDRKRPKHNDKRIHGYGLYNVRNTVEKYKGHVDVQSDETAFKVTIVLNLGREAK